MKTDQVKLIVNTIRKLSEVINKSNADVSQDIIINIDKSLFALTEQVRLNNLNGELTIKEAVENELDTVHEIVNAAAKSEKNFAAEDSLLYYRFKHDKHKHDCDKHIYAQNLLLNMGVRIETNTNVKNG
tara:strand:- start:9150 stop:9536 length:387 start_codon:yes stop_codon:yes gene_type:complete